MSGNPRASRVFLWINSLAVGVPGLGCAAPPGSANDMARCAVITAADERLACYDALFCARIAASDERLACYDARAKPKSPEPQGAPAVAARAAREPGGAARFAGRRGARVSGPGAPPVRAAVAGLRGDLVRTRVADKRAPDHSEARRVVR